MRSIVSVATGILFALGVGLLTIFGLIWPIFMTFFDADVAWNVGLAYALVFSAVAFSFYWGGYIASYKAPSKRRLHGTLVAPIAFVISPVLNFVTGKGLFPGLNSAGTLAAVLAMLVVSIGTAYLGARRGESLYAHNESHARKRAIRRERESKKSRQSQEG